MALRLRSLADSEQAASRRLARSRTGPARLVQRAQMGWRAAHGEAMDAIAAALGGNGEPVRRWVKRLGAQGGDGRRDRPRRGRPPTYTAEAVGTLRAAARTTPFGSWTLDRLAAYLQEQQGSARRRSRIAALRITAGVRWRTHETWFGERVDPACAEKS